MKALVEALVEALVVAGGFGRVWEALEREVIIFSYGWGHHMECLLF